MTDDDSTLVARVAGSDDRAAFAELVGRHQSAVRNFLRHLTRGDTLLADDLAQDTFIQAYRSLGYFRGDSTFATWLLGIAHNLARNALRRQRTVPLDSTWVEDLNPVASTTTTSDLKHDFAHALRQLAPEEQSALHLRYQQGLSDSDIAAVLGWPLGTVKTHLLRGKARLRTLLASWNPQT